MVMQVMQKQKASNCCRDAYSYHVIFIFCLRQCDVLRHHIVKLVAVVSVL